MSKLLSLLFFVAFIFGAALQAEEKRQLIISFQDVTTEFIIDNPPGWEFADPSDPFDAKFVNGSKTSECYVQVWAYYKAPDKEDLYEDCIDGIYAFHDFMGVHFDGSVKDVYTHQSNEYTLVNFISPAIGSTNHVAVLSLPIHIGNTHGVVCFVITNTKEDSLDNKIEIIQEFIPYVRMQVPK